MGLLPRALSSSSSGGDTPPTPVPTTARALWSAKVVLTAADVSNKYFDLPTDAPNIAAGFGPNVIVTVETTVQYTPRSYIATTNEAGALRRISWNGMDLEDDPPLQAGFNLWVIYPVQITLEGSAGTYKHDELIHRDYVDQHPIEAITGLKDALQRLADGQTANSHDKGWFMDAAALNAAYPAANAGDFATVGATDTVWLWSVGDGAWVDSGAGGNVVSITTPVGGRETGDVNITINKLGLTGDPAAINDAVTKSHAHANKALLDTLTGSGDGTKFLNDKGLYAVTPSGGDMYKADYDPDSDGSVSLADTIKGWARAVLMAILNAASYLRIDGDGAKFLTDNGQYVARSSTWDRWRQNQEVQLNEIAPNGKRYYGYLVHASAIVPPVPVEDAALQASMLSVVYTIPNIEWSTMMVDGASARITMPSSLKLTLDLPSVHVGRDWTLPNTNLGFHITPSDGGVNAITIWVGNSFTGAAVAFDFYIKYTKSTDSPIA